MKFPTITLLTPILILTTNIQPTYAQSIERGLSLFAGYKSLEIDYDFGHDTHPDDFSLLNSSVPNSAGETELNSLDFFQLGVSYRVPVSDQWSLNVDFGGLLGNNRDERKNANDNRPDAGAAFVYSEANFGLFTNADITYHINRFLVGAEFQLSGIFIESGWDRFDRDEADESSFELVPTGGIKLGYQIGDNWEVDGTVQFGENGASYGAKVLISL